MDYTEVVRLASTIKYLEDKLLRSKNIHEKLKLQEDLMGLRIKYQKLQQNDSKRTGFR